MPKRPKISILGGGNVGASCALWAASRELGDIVVVDIPEAEDRVKGKMLDLAADALDANSKRLTDQATQSLDGKKALIDQAVKAVNDRLTQMATFMQTTEAERKESFGSLSTSVASLSTTTGELHRMLASSQRRSTAKPASPAS